MGAYTPAAHARSRHTDIRKKSGMTSLRCVTLHFFFTSSCVCACVAALCNTVQIHRCDFQQLYSEKDGHSSGVRVGRGTDSIYRERSISSKGVSVLYLLVTARASPLAWGRLSPGLGSSRFGEMVEAGLDAPLLALGLGVLGLARTRLVRASRVPSGSTIMFMAAE